MDIIPFEKFRNAETIKDFGRLFREIHNIMSSFEFSIAEFWKSINPRQTPSRAQIRKWKEERKRARHYFLTHGKHGLKRPKGKRKV